MDHRGKDSVNKWCKGITLIELVVAVSILSVIVITATTLLSFGQKSFVAIDNNGQIQTEAYNVVTIMSAKVRVCNTVQVVSPSQLDLSYDHNIVIRFEWNGTDTLTQTEYDNGAVTTTKVISDNVDEAMFTQEVRGVNIKLILSSKGQTFELETKTYRRS